MLVGVNIYRGFTLIELAVVLFIVSLLLGGILSPLSTRLEQKSREQTSDMLIDIEESLLGYALINGRLPCPDCPDGNVGACGALAAALRNDGIEDTYIPATDTVCRANVGNLPWVDLQTPEYDAWSRHFTYHVTSGFSDDLDGTACGIAATGVSFEICSAGDIDIYDGYIVATTGYTDATLLAAVPPVFRVAEGVPAIVISHGGDAIEAAQTAQQVENYGRKPVYPDTGGDVLTSYTATDFTSNAFVYSDFARDSSINPPTLYDDLMIWISPAILMNRMVISGKLP